MIILPDTLWSRLLDEFRWPRKSVERVSAPAPHPERSLRVPPQHLSRASLR